MDWRLDVDYISTNFSPPALRAAFVLKPTKFCRRSKLNEFLKGNAECRLMPPRYRALEAMVCQALNPSI